MDRTTFESKRRSVVTPSGHISYVENGNGPVALFVHGVLLNSYLWRHQLTALGDERRCIAVDLLAHGATRIDPQQDVSYDAQAAMLAQFLDALDIGAVDLVGNDSGGAIAQIFAANHPQRIRSLTLTDCDAHDNWPPQAVAEFLQIVASGGLSKALEKMLADKGFARSAQGFGLWYERPQNVADETFETYLRPLVSSSPRVHDLERFFAAWDNTQTVRIEQKLRTLNAPTLIVWATDDIFFDVKWSHWLARTIPGTRRRVELAGARLLFPEERPKDFNDELRAHWRSISNPQQPLGVD
jgi:pimeloyl-ACP methyl ester carboxylesterase